MRVIVDTDPGIDDAVAIALAMRSPELEIAAVTTVFGNTTVDRATRNTREVLARLGMRDRIPVFAGADRPLLRPLAVAADTHGETGFGYAGHAFEPEPPPGTPPREPPWTEATEGIIEAPGALQRLAASSPAPMTLICLGPLTNVALALALNRELLRAQVKEIVLMGGEPNGFGNATPVSEFNCWCDPEATAMVFSSGIPLRMVGLNVTRHMVVTRAAVETLCADGDPTRCWWGDMLRFYEEFHRVREGLEGCVINDPLAVALAMHPEFGTAEPMHVAIDRADGLTRGQTVCDRLGLTGEPPNAVVYTEVDAASALRLVNDRVFGFTAPPNPFS
ncbi:MAG: Pyrimidine-specific ribonucleoside hydrolase RihA [bacterium ADurb.Bin429]|nr:MAG: Pyrimidine-specific ribonucleoside hydrolase RihA [bacterium ADurb.Bin429]